MATDDSVPDLTNLRIDYRQRALSEREVDPDPIRQFTAWLNEAIAAKANEPNAMTLATVDGGQPDARVVLLKGVDTRGLVFFTSYASRKGQQLATNPNAALVFWWAELERQVRVHGVISKVTSEESDAYFRQRPIASQIGAAASDQSQVVPSRAILEERFAALQSQYPNGEMPRPSSWGGYRLAPSAFEFWQGRRSRLHDRVEYRREGLSWTIRRLSP